MTDIPHFNVDNIQWHDDQGHIFKDKLIEVFDAIEDRINFVSSYKFGDTEKIDISSVVYPDVSSVDIEEGNNKIINFKSFANIMDLVNFPLEIITDGNVKVLSVKYINSDYDLIEVKPENGITATTEYPYIFLDTETNEIVRLDYFDGDIPLLAYLKDNVLYTGNSKIPGNINFLKILAHQPKEAVDRVCNLDDNKTQRFGGALTLGGGIGSPNGYNKNYIGYTNYFKSEKSLREEHWQEKEVEEDDL